MGVRIALCYWQPSLNSVAGGLIKARAIPVQKGVRIAQIKEKIKGIKVSKEHSESSLTKFYGLTK